MRVDGRITYGREVIKAPKLPRDESERLQALHALEILDTDAEERFDRLTRLLQKSLGTPMANISLVDADRQWFKSRVGLEDSETARDISFCGHGILGKEIFEVPDALLDPRFADNPLVTGPPNIRFYAGAPLTTHDGHRVGMLCALSDQPRQLSERERTILRDLADCVEAEINVLERRRLEAQLADSQARSKTMLQAMPDIVFLVDRAGVCLESNDHSDLLLPRSEMLGRRISDILPPPVDAQWTDALSKALSDDQLVRFDYVLQQPQGLSHFEARVQPLGDDELLVLIRNISAESAAKTKLLRQQQLAEIITRVQAQFILESDRHKALDGLLNDLLAITESEYGFIAEVLQRDDGKPYLKMFSITNISWNEQTDAFYESNALQGMEFDSLETLFGGALTSGEPVIANAPDEDPRRGGLPDGHPALNAFLGVPVDRGGEIVAVFGLANRPQGYDQELVDFLEPLTATLGQLVYAARIRDQHLAAQAQVVRLSRVANETTNGVIITDAAGRVSWINDGFERISGFTLDEMRGYKPGDLLQGPDSDPAVVTEMREALEQRQDLEVDLVNYTKNGRPYWIRIHCSPLHDASGVLEGFMAIESDITSQKQAEQNLRQFKDTLDQTLDSVFMFDTEALRFTYANAGALQQVGYSREELLSMHPFDIKPDIDENQLRALIAPLLSGEQASLTFETVHQHKNGQLLPVEIFLQHVAPPEDRERFVAIVRDITERKRAEAQLKESENFLSTVLDSMPLPIFHKDKKGRYTGFNKAFESFFGKPQSELIGRSVFDIHPPELAHIYHQQDKRLFDDVQTQSYESQAKNAYSQTRDVVFHKATLTNFRGEITGLVGAVVDVTERKQADAEIHRLAYYDSLTDLPNRRLLQDRLHHAMALCRRGGGHGALIFLDIDDFKELNDSRGHDAGDRLLVEVKQRLVAGARESDTVARMGGDEFVVMLEDLSDDPEEAAIQTRQVGEKIRVDLAVPYQLGDAEYRSTASLGIALFDGHEESIEVLLKHADLAMYRAKDGGRNTVRFFDPGMQTALDERIALERDLRLALELGQLKPYYQPQVDQDRRVIGAEVLLRWLHPTRGMVSPADFIPLAETTGMILPIGHWVLRGACEQIAKWSKDSHMRHLRLAVNASPLEFRQPNFVDLVKNTLNETGADPARLKLELTESIVLEDVTAAFEKMQALKQLGIGFALDDFGTGHSSLAYLTQLPLETLKIDSSFVFNLPDSHNDAVVAQTIIAMARNLGLNVIAEGVETEPQLAFLALHRCHEYQGFLFSRPVPLELFKEYCAGSLRK
jgi:diguanylate cyclase (GGDEF)-like protein/PAS domain S-box-containing protein